MLFYIELSQKNFNLQTVYDTCAIIYKLQLSFFQPTFKKTIYEVKYPENFAPIQYASIQERVIMGQMQSSQFGLIVEIWCQSH